MILQLTWIVLLVAFAATHDDCLASEVVDQAPWVTDARVARYLSPVDDPMRGFLHSHPAGQETNLVFPYRLSWRKRLERVGFSELRNSIDGRVFVTRVEPAITLRFRNSLVDLHGRGIRYQGAHDGWSLSLHYRRLDTAPDLELRIDDRTERPKLLKIEWSLVFD